MESMFYSNGEVSQSLARTLVNSDLIYDYPSHFPNLFNNCLTNIALFIKQRQ